MGGGNGGNGREVILKKIMAVNFSQLIKEETLVSGTPVGPK